MAGEAMSETVPRATLNLRFNERVKFAASLVDKMSLAVAVTGYIAPIVNGTLQGGGRVGVTLIWLAISVAM